MTYADRLKDQAWLDSKCHSTSLYLTAKALGKGNGEAWQAFKKEHLGKTTHRELAVLQGKVVPTVKVDNRKVEQVEPVYANFLTVVKKEFGSMKREIKSYVRSEIKRQLNAR